MKYTTSLIYQIAKLFLNDDVTAKRRYTAIEAFDYRYAAQEDYPRSAEETCESDFKAKTEGRG